MLVKRNSLIPADVSHALQKARRTKDEKEIELVRKACDITSRAFNLVLDFLDSGKTELDAAAFISSCMQSGGASGLAFDTICAFGRNEPTLTTARV